MELSGQISYPEYINNVSAIISKLRSATNVEVMMKNPEYDRGHLNESSEILGLKGELIAQNFFFQNGVKFQFADFVNAHDKTKADIIIGNRFIDVKSVNPEAPHLLVNEKSHKRLHKQVTHYFFIQVLSKDTALYWIVPYEDVNDWEVKFFKYTNAYCKLISNC